MGDRIRYSLGTTFSPGGGLYWVWLCDVTAGSLPWAAGLGAVKAAPRSGGVALSGLTTPLPEQLLRVFGAREVLTWRERNKRC